MSKKRGIWGFGSPLSRVRDWCKRTTGRYSRFAGAGDLRMAGRENRSEVVRPIVHVDFDGGLVEFKQFIQVLRIGDRVRVFCDDGVIEAEKISPKLFKLIYVVETTGSIHGLESQLSLISKGLGSNAELSWIAHPLQCGPLPILLTNSSGKNDSSEISLIRSQPERIERGEHRRVGKAFFHFPFIFQLSALAILLSAAVPALCGFLL
jgi:hypothetical protein